MHRQFLAEIHAAKLRSIGRGLLDEVLRADLLVRILHPLLREEEEERHKHALDARAQEIEQHSVREAAKGLAATCVAKARTPA